MKLLVFAGIEWADALFQTTFKQPSNFPTAFHARGTRGTPPGLAVALSSRSDGGRQRETPSTRFAGFAFARLASMFIISTNAENAIAA